MCTRMFLLCVCLCVYVCLTHVDLVLMCTQLQQQQQQQHLAAAAAVVVCYVCVFMFVTCCSAPTCCCGVYMWCVCMFSCYMFLCWCAPIFCCCVCMWCAFPYTCMHVYEWNTLHSTAWHATVCGCVCVHGIYIYILYVCMYNIHKQKFKHIHAYIHTLTCFDQKLIICWRRKIMTERITRSDCSTTRNGSTCLQQLDLMLYMYVYMCVVCMYACMCTQGIYIYTYIYKSHYAPI
jgi:hypothetical protein